MNFSWYSDLYKIGSMAGIKAVTVRMVLAVGIPLIGGGTLGYLLGGSPNANETVVLISALVAGWASGAHPGIAAVTRFFAIATAAATGMRFTDPDVLLSLVAGGVSALTAAILVWKWFGIPTDDNVMDWRTGVRRAFAGEDSGARYALCYGAAAAAALFAAASARVGFAINPALGFMSFTMFLLFVVHVSMVSAGVMPHLLGARIYDVLVGCVLALAGTLAATYPRFTPKTS